MSKLRKNKEDITFIYGKIAYCEEITEKKYVNNFKYLDDTGKVRKLKIIRPIKNEQK